MVVFSSKKKVTKMPGFVVCGPNEALIVSGCCHSKPYMVAGGRVFVWPWIQIVQRLSLNTITLIIESAKVYAKHGVPVSVTGIAQVKIQGQSSDMLRTAAEQFLGKTQQEIANVIQETVEGHQRATIATLSLEEIYKFRKRFSKKVIEVASPDLCDMGFTIVSYTIRDISDDEGYLKALGEAKTASVKSDARCGEAEAMKEAAIEEAKSEQERMISRYENDAEVARALHNFEIKKAEYDIEVFTKKAEADLAYDLQLAVQRQKISAEQMATRLAEKCQDVLIAEQEIQRKEKQLEHEVKRVAESEKAKLETLAKAYSKKLIAESEARAEVLTAKGKAAAEAIMERATSESEQMAKKADAFKMYERAAKVEMILDVLPRFAAECAAPLSQAEKVQLISTGDGPVGASKLVGEILDIMSKTYTAVLQMGHEDYGDRERSRIRS